MALRFNTLLREANIDPGSVRLLRHQPRVGDQSLLDIWRTDRDKFERYQAYQAAAKRSQFSRAYWATFIGTWDGRTVFSGLYAVGSPEASAEPVADAITGELEAAGILDLYPATHLSVLTTYEGRLYIDWGGGSSGKRAWVQRAENQDKLISELHLGAAEEPFPGMLELVRSLSELAYAPPSWIQRLSAAKGVYLLSCPRDGSLYVGSATGEGGFWARWSEYRSNGHGGNVALRSRPPSDFRVSILQVAGSADTKQDIERAEDIWKAKLQSRTLGLNRNGPA